MKWTEEIKITLSSPGYRLPGMDAQYVLSPPARDVLVKNTADRIMSQASVLLAVYPSGYSYHLSFMKRTEHPMDKHSGQISFPGGKSEESDKGLLDTALREYEEEMGIGRASWSETYAMTPLRIPVSNFQVNPFLALSMKQLSFVPEVSEVAAILEPSIEELFDLDRYDIRSLRLRQGVKINVPTFQYREEQIWGATAMILSEFLSIVNPAFFEKLQDKISRLLQ